MTKDRREKIFKKYETIAQFISKCFGPNVEVVLHDIKDFDHSARCIFNNSISGREKGAPMTQFGLNLLENKIYDKENFVNNYKGMVNGKLIRSSTLFIYDDAEKIIGMMCVNVDISEYVALSNTLDKLSYYGIDESMFDDSKEMADFPKSINEKINTSLTKFVSKYGSNINRLTKEEKMDIVRELDKEGIFKLKGGLMKVSSSFNISEPTIYRYLNQINKK